MSLSVGADIETQVHLMLLRRSWGGLLMLKFDANAVAQTLLLPLTLELELLQGAR